MKYILTIIVSIFCLGCNGRSQSELNEENTKNFNSPTVVGKLPDGRSINCVKRELSFTTHFIYFIDNTVTVNHLETTGKTQTNKVEVLINGQKYFPAEEPKQ